MKAKFNLGFLTGYMNVPNAWPGNKVSIPVLETKLVIANDSTETIVTQKPLKTLVFECIKLDEDKSAVYELLEIQ